LRWKALGALAVVGAGAVAAGAVLLLRADEPRRDLGPVKVAQGRTAAYPWEMVARSEVKLLGEAVGPCLNIENGSAVCQRPKDDHALIGMLAGERWDIRPGPIREHIAFGIASPDVERIDLYVNLRRWRTVRPQRVSGFDASFWHAVIPADVRYIDVDAVALDSKDRRIGTLTSDGPDRPLRPNP
jgi:hypothetical protein